VFRKDVSVTLM